MPAPLPFPPTRADDSQSRWVEVSSDALRHNLRQLKGRIPSETALAAVVKSDGYGHGMLATARAAAEAGCRFLAVLSPEEGAGLRAAGFDCGILVVGPLLPAQAEAAAGLDLSCFVGGVEAARALNAAGRRLRRQVRIHLKLDTGMGRFGFAADPESLSNQVDAVLPMENLDIEGVATHLSEADLPDSEFTAEQARRFRLALRLLEAKGLHPRWIHAANSGGILHFPETAFSLVRAGIAMYGVPPGPPTAGVDLRPAMRLLCRIADIRDLPAGVPVSYGRTFHTTRPTRMALLPVGYGNGYPRSASGKASVLVHGVRAPLLGRITMNLSLADVTDIPQARVGDTVLLFGRDDAGAQVGVEEVAEAAGTIPYEVLCNVGRCAPRFFPDA